MNDDQLLLVEVPGRSLHIVDPGATHAYCGRPLKGNRQFAHPWREDLVPASWHGDPETGPRQRTVADVRWRGRLHGICKRCREKAGVEA